MTKYHIVAGKAPDSVGGTAYAAVNPDYSGPCLMYYRGHREWREAIFPCYDVAESAACYAVGVTTGGYSLAIITEAPNLTVTHQTLEDWICSD